MSQKVYPRTFIFQSLVPGGVPGNMPVIGPAGILMDSLVAAKYQPRVAKVTVTTPPDALEHATALVLPAKALVLDCWIDVTTADTVPGGSNVTVGPAGAPAGWLGTAPLTAGVKLGNPALDGTLNWYVTNGYGPLLSQFVAGTNADDRGLFTKLTDATSGGLAVSYQADQANNGAFDIYVLFVDLT